LAAAAFVLLFCIEFLFIRRLIRNEPTAIL
jgi:hypothetical protein